MYSHKIFQHFKNPHNKGILSDADLSFVGQNPFCGDDITLALKFNQQGEVIKVAWAGQGCVISQAAASIFSDMILNKNLEQIKKISNEEFLQKIDIKLSPTRIKCALLPLYVVKGLDVDE